MSQGKTTNQESAQAEDQVATPLQPQSSGFIPRMIELWKQIIFHPDEFLENLPDLKIMLSFISFNYLIISVVSLINTWIIMGRIYDALGENLSFGTVFGEFIKWFFIAGVMIFISLFVLAGFVYLLTKAFGNNENNFYSVLDVVFAPMAIGFLTPLSIVFVAAGVNIDIYNVNISQNILMTGILMAIFGIFSVYLGYLVVAGLKKVCNISAISASTSLVLAIFAYAVLFWVIFKPQTMIQNTFYQDEYKPGQDGICNVDAAYDPDCDDYDYY
jgi:hypothetical protein